MGLVCPQGKNNLCDALPDPDDTLQLRNPKAFDGDFTPFQGIHGGLVASNFESVFLVKLHQFDDQLELADDSFLVQNLKKVNCR